MMQCWNVVQHDLSPKSGTEIVVKTLMLERVICALIWARVETLVLKAWQGLSRPPLARSWLVAASVGEAAPGLRSTAGLIERPTIVRALRSVSDTSLGEKRRSEANFSHDFKEFAPMRLPERASEALLTKQQLGGDLVGHLSGGRNIILQGSANIMELVNFGFMTLSAGQQMQLRR